MASSSAAVHRLSTAMERTGRWVFSQEVPSDIVIKVDDATFPLHKFILVAKSGYIRKKIVESDKSDLGMLELKGIPGGAEAFEKAARFCYGVNFEISVENVAALHCAAEWLEMTEKSCEGNLAARADEFIAKAALITLSGAVTVLKSCQKLLPFAEKLRIVQRCVDAIGSKATHEANSPSRSPPDWWAAELAMLNPPFFQKALAAMKARGAIPKTLSTSVAVYAGKSLPELLPLSSSCGRGPSPAASSAGTDRSTQRNFIESFIAILPTDHDTPLPVGFLCCLLRAAIFLNSSAASRRDLERRISTSLDQVAVGDLMAIAFDYSGQRLADLDSIRRIVTGFAEREVAGAVAQRTARVVDAFVAEIATEEDLPVSKFAGIAGALPKSSRRFDDDLYRAAPCFVYPLSLLHFHFRYFGLASDNVEDIRIVVASGEIMDRQSMGEDLFWALRGGGGASFGIILAYKVRLVEVPNKVTVFTVSKTLEEGATKLVDKWQRVAHKVDKRLFIRTLFTVVGNDSEHDHQNKTNRTVQVSFNSLFVGEKKELLLIMEDCFPELQLKAEDCIEMRWIESVLYFAGYQGKPLSSLLERYSPVYNTSFKHKADFLTEPIPLEGWNRILRRFLEKGEQPMMIIDPWGGRMDEISENETAFPHRKGNLYNVHYLTERWVENDAAVSIKHVDWLRRFYKFMTPYVSKNPRAAYLNYRDLDIGTDVMGNKTTYWKARRWGERYYKGNFKRLAYVKGKVDPNNMFRNEQSIPPLLF